MGRTFRCRAGCQVCHCRGQHGQDCCAEPCAIIQGTMRYLYKTKTYASSKEAGELWAFASPILPFVHKVDPAAAEKLYRRAWALDYSTDSYTDVKEALESTYNSLGVGAGVGLVTCAAVGDMYDDVGQAVVAPGCSDSSGTTDKLPIWGIALLVVFAICIFVMIAMITIMYIKERAGKPVFRPLTENPIFADGEKQSKLENGVNGSNGFPPHPENGDLNGLHAV